MNTRYFLGANSSRGFASLYDGFASGEEDFLHVIKGGPGTGKSGFMRAIGRAAEDRGYDVEYVLCSGDPESLDGIYIPARHEAWVDGTAPHVIDPKLFAAVGDYVNIGQFCTLPMTAAEAEHIRELNKTYKARYARAYALLNAAESVHRAYSQNYIGDEKLNKAKKRCDGILSRLKAGRAKSKTPEKLRFYSAISCSGCLFLEDEIRKLCPVIYELDDKWGAAEEVLQHIKREAQRRGAEIIYAPSPLAPERAEAVLLPEAGAAFIAGDRRLEGAKHIRLDAMADPDTVKTIRGDIREKEKTEARLIKAAVDVLRGAKELHDELESIYKPHMDFAALNKYTRNECKKIV